MTMNTILTTDQILALAPDASSAKAGQGLAAPRKWVTLGRDERSAWGECQGSAREPYQVQIELSEPAFHCTCPSRKFPCKHALGLFLLLANQLAAFKQTKPPAWVTEWLSKRAERAERAEKRAQKKAQAEPVADVQAQAKRAAAREDKITAGLTELELWLADLMRQGLASAQAQPAKFWETMAARMVDAQAPGLARQLREMDGLASSGEGWQARLLERLGRLHLLIEGYKHVEMLAPETQADVRTLMGWTQDQDKLLAKPGLRDEWLVLGQRAEDEERMRVQRTWLWGCGAATAAPGRAALILDFAIGKQPLDVSLVPGTALDAELVFFPGNYPLRALIKTRHGAPVPGAPAPLDGLPGYANISAAMAAYAEALGRYPWLERFPLALQAVVPLRRESGWFMRDADGAHALPLDPHFEEQWPLMALSGGHPINVFGEWNGEHLLPLSVWTDGRFVCLAGVGT